MTEIYLKNKLRLFTITKENDFLEFHEGNFDFELENLFPNLIIKNVFNNEDLEEIIKKEYEALFTEEITLKDLDTKFYELKDINNLFDINLKIEIIKIINKYKLNNIKFVICIRFYIENIDIKDQK